MKTNLKPLTCEKARELMFDYIDGELKEGDRLRLEAHLEGCEACRDELSERSEMLTLISSCSDAPPQSLKLGVMEKIENIPQETRAQHLRHRLIPAGALTVAAAAVMILVVGKGFIFGGAVNDVAMDDEKQLSIVADKYDSPEVAYDRADGVGKVDDNEACDIAEEDMVYTAAAEAVTENETVSEPVLVELYATTTALKAASPGYGLILGVADDYAASNSQEAPSDIEASGKSLATLAAVSPIDELFDKMRSYDAAIVVCEETDMVLLDGAVAMESLELNGAEFRRISVEADAMTVFTDLLTYLEDIEAQYRAAVPEGDFTRCEIFMLTGAEN